MRNDKLRFITATINGKCIALRVHALGLTANQLNLLIAISKMEKATAKRLSAVMLMDPSTVSRSLERIRKEGWLKRTTGPDARCQELSVTEKGLNILGQAFPSWQKAQVRARKVLGPKNASALDEVAEVLWSKAPPA
jgi:DNA-binding MarR family transcriptional regulator